MKLAKTKDLTDQEFTAVSQMLFNTPILDLCQDFKPATIADLIARGTELRAADCDTSFEGNIRWHNTLTLLKSIELAVDHMRSKSLYMIPVDPSVN